jgi:DNA polymerase-3 subunit gamma/tau
MTALRKNRVNHAYLFSGPRGCGKTTSARILARCLNCAEGPTDTPCGKCPSCIELARGGSGSLDVIEIDAASHGGVDDARDLRERATYAPVRDRYKIFIIDEAHMVTSAGFNALLKIVEEPPEHIKFIFATTEPDKVIGTIRSRTHHYPFRLVPPEPLMAYLELLCSQEKVPVAPGVLSLVIRAGGGSVRDSLSVLDQLMAGAGPNGLDYELAVALLGYTHASLLDDVVEAVAASDAATVFRAVDRVIQTGHDPRRFVEDLLERFRDLIIVQAMPESAQSILRGMPSDQIARLQNQAHNLGAAELSRAADVTNAALTEMTGATSPRLHLELLCARILLPSSEQTERGIAARIDRVERRLNYAGNDVGSPASPDAAVEAPRIARPEAVSQRPVQVPQREPAPEPAPAPAPAPSVPEARQPLTAPRVSTTDWPVDETKASRQPAQPSAPEQAQGPAAERETAPAASNPAASNPAVSSPAVSGPPAPAPPASPQAQSVTAPAPAPASAPAPAPQAAAAAPGHAGADVEVLRRAWPEVLQTLAKIKRSTWALVEPNAQVGQFDGQVLTLAFSTTGLAGAFGRADHSENLRQAIHKTVGIDCQINAVAGGSRASASSVSSEPNPKAPASRDVPATSADAAWGLAPAAAGPVTPPAPVPASGAASAGRGSGPDGALPASRSASAEPAAPEKPSTESPGIPSAHSLGPVATPPPVPTAGRQPTPDAVAPAGPEIPEPPADPEPATDHSGSYDYPDDDWGPPRDEDAPPLDEEPPIDWAPSVPASTLPAQRVPAAPVSQKASAPTAPGVAARAGQPGAPASRTPGTANDPWARAVEQSPGIWTVGSDSNVGRHTPAAAPEPVAEPEPVQYEPAAAQIPQYAGAMASVSSAPDTSAAWGSPAPASAAPSTSPVTSAPVASAADSLTVAAAAIAPIAAPSTRVAAPATAPDSGAAARQSLYQRLSNSPEAEAGRAKAPARAAAAATYVQDIPSADDETIEESGVFGRAAVERILGGKLVEERSLDGSPLAPRF